MILEIKMLFFITYNGSIELKNRIQFFKRFGGQKNLLFSKGKHLYKLFQVLKKSAEVTFDG